MKKSKYRIETRDVWGVWRICVLFKTTRETAFACWARCLPKDNGLVNMRLMRKLDRQERKRHGKKWIVDHGKAYYV